MFEMFTDAARRAVVLAQEEARALGHADIGTEHLLLGVLHRGVPTAAGTALLSLEISSERARADIEAEVGCGASAPDGHLPWRPEAKEALELSLEEATALGAEEVGPEHLVLGILRVPETLGARMLGRLGADPLAVRTAVLSQDHA